MADNVNITPGTGAEIAADDIAGVLHQRVKVQFGADGSATDASAANPLPVVVTGTATVTGALTDTQLRATAVPVSGPLTDTQLRADPVVVTLLDYVADVLGPLTDTELRAADVAVTLDSEVVDVLGPLTDTELRAADVAITLDGEEVVVIEKVVPLTSVVGTVASIGDNTLIAAPGEGDRLCIAELTLQLEGATATTVTVKSGSTVIRRWYFSAAGAGVTWVFDQGREMRLGDNELLAINLSGANTVGYTVRYFEEAV
jgi:hypothetical protein